MESFLDIEKDAKKIEEIKKALKKVDKEKRHERAEREKIFNQFLRSVYVFFDNRNIALTFQELQNSYVYGNYISTISLSQLLIEQYLKSLIESKNDKINDEKIEFWRLLELAFEEKILNVEEREALMRLSGIRNSYTHPKAWKKNEKYYKNVKNHSYECLKISSQIINHDIKREED